MDWIKKFWNKDIAGHPLNWLILIVMVVMICFVIDALLDQAGATKHVSIAKHVKRHTKRNGSGGGQSATVANGVNSDAGDSASAYDTGLSPT